ncbi:MAG TPA: dTDP-4-amino-4,6-dideoxygalactose transaminase [Bacteroidales bacterium]|nr:dTDP-4-amino-4,6-dideoxygalactose transaminase [Bacteroidales bacterium]
MIRIPFNKPYISGKEFEYMKDAADRGHLSGNGYYTKKCQAFFEEHYGFKKCLLTTSCTDALEMAAMLLNLGPEDEVIVPSYTFVSTALAFVRQGAKVVFADSKADHPNMDEDKIEELITPRTKAIVPMHYAGNACDMDKIMALAEKYGLWVVEDDALAIDSYYKGKALGSIGHMGCFSFHETKGIQCGEGGMLVINDEGFIKRAEIIWEKGTDRAAFFRGDVDKYGWVDLGSSFQPSELNAAFLYAQLENLDKIQARRLEIWNAYNEKLAPLAEKGLIHIPGIPEYASNNAHEYYFVCRSAEERDQLIGILKDKGIQAVFHYQGLHRSRYFKEKNKNQTLDASEIFTDCLLRLPLYYTLDENQTIQIINSILTDWRS